MSLEEHPWVAWVSVAGAVATGLVALSGRVRELLRPLYAWLTDSEVRHLERVRRIEVAAAALNDARNETLMKQIAALSLQLDASLRASREAEQRHAEEMASLRAELAAQTNEIVALRAELAEYRNKGE
ncbi:hypothetical protein [Tomitella gaofuii]|uniref:hypothetical protein n=1 Tax=Tomitella gaofuii TaxID=2760083 RepID=UPI0015F842AD|nr:hypothetical protein [Tomitella gaofuii]